MQEVTIAEAAQKFGVSQHTVMRWLKTGDLEGYKDPSAQGYRWIIKLDQDRMATGVTAANSAPARPGISESANYDTTAEAQPVWTLIDTIQQQIEEKDRQLQEKDRQVQEKDRQIEQLLVLVSQAQAALPAPQDSPWWWRWTPAGKGR